MFLHTGHYICVLWHVFEVLLSLFALTLLSFLCAAWYRCVFSSIVWHISKALDMHSRCTRIKSWLCYHLSWWRFFVLSLPIQMPGQCFQ